MQCAVWWVRGAERVGVGVSLNHHKELEKNYADYDNQDKLNAPGPT